MENIGYRIKKRRKDLGYTASQLAELVGKDRATIYRYENGDIESLPTPIIIPLSNALKTTPAYLLGFDDERLISKEKLDLQHLNLHFAFFTQYKNMGTTPIELFEQYYRVFYGAGHPNHRTTPKSSYTVSSTEQLIKRYQDIYLKKSLITEEEKDDFNSVFDGQIDFDDTRYYYREYQSSNEEFIELIKSHKTIPDKYREPIEVAFEYERDVKLMLLKGAISNDEYISLIKDVDIIKHNIDSALVKSFNDELDKFLSIKYNRVPSLDELNESIQIPIYERINTPNDIEAGTEVKETLTVPQSLLKPLENYFAKYQQSDSMIDENINVGDLLVFEKTDTLDNGMIGYFTLENNKGTCKKFYYDKASEITTLQPSNSKYSPTIITKKTKNFHIIGKLVLVINKIKTEK